MQESIIPIIFAEMFSLHNIKNVIPDVIIALAAAINTSKQVRYLPMLISLKTKAITHGTIDAKKQTIKRIENGKNLVIIDLYAKSVDKLPITQNIITIGNTICGFSKVCEK